MSKEVNKQAVELCKYFYRAINKKVTPALMKIGIGQFKNLLNVYTYEELESVIKWIEDGNITNVYSPGYLSFATNKILDDIKLKEVKEQKIAPVKTNSVLDLKLENNKKEKQSNFIDKFIKKSKSVYAYCNGYGKTKYRTTQPRAPGMGKSVHIQTK